MLLFYDVMGSHRYKIGAVKIYSITHYSASCLNDTRPKGVSLAVPNERVFVYIHL
jgi:hypothetical protein